MIWNVSVQREIWYMTDLLQSGPCSTNEEKKKSSTSYLLSVSLTFLSLLVSFPYSLNLLCNGPKASTMKCSIVLLFIMVPCVGRFDKWQWKNVRQTWLQILLLCITYRGYARKIYRGDNGGDYVSLYARKLCAFSIVCINYLFLFIFPPKCYSILMWRCDEVEYFKLE